MKVKAFALDPLFLFAGVVIFTVAIIMTVLISAEYQAATVGMPGAAQVVEFNTNFYDLDWAIPFFVGSCCVAMLLYSSLAGAVPISIVLFMIMAIIVDVVIVYVNNFNVWFFDLSNAITPLNMPLTHLTLTYLPAILTIQIILMGILMHSRTQY